MWQVSGVTLAGCWVWLSLHFRFRYSTSIHTIQGPVNTSTSEVYYSGVGEMRGVPKRSVLLVQWGSNVWAERMPDHGDKYRTGPLWDFCIMPGHTNFH